jgi:hypothetical protein
MCSLAGLQELLVDLRTREAQGRGTDVRLVLLETIVVEGRIHALDNFIATLAGDGGPGLMRAMRADPVMLKLADVWLGIDLEEQTMRLREVDDLLALLVPQEAL